MNDVISRQTAIDDIETVNPSMPLSVNWVKNWVKTLPSVQPEQKKGKWIVHPEVKNVYGGTYIECSQCGEKYVVQHMKDEKYCRNCGVKMEV